MDKDQQIVTLLSHPASRAEGIRMLMSEYQERLFSHLYKMLMDEEQAKDCLQETFIKVWQKFDAYSGKSALYTWVYRIATNEALQALRKRKPTEEVSELHLAQAPSISEDANAILEKLYAALANLPEKQRLVFHLRYFDELSYDELTKVLGGSIGGLKANYHHAVKKIESFLKTH